MRPDAVWQAMEDRQEFDLGLQNLESPFDVGQRLVTRHALGRGRSREVGNEDQFAIHRPRAPQRTCVGRVGEQIRGEIDFDDVRQRAPCRCGLSCPRLTDSCPDGSGRIAIGDQYHPLDRIACQPFLDRRHQRRRLTGIAGRDLVMERLSFSRLARQQPGLADPQRQRKADLAGRFLRGGLACRKTATDSANARRIPGLVPKLVHLRPGATRESLPRLSVDLPQSGDR